MRPGLSFATLTLLAACPGPSPSSTTTGGGPVVCQAAPAGTLYSGECTPAQDTTFCLFTQNTGF